MNPEFPKTDFCYTIEGNIGCGKSTFLELLRRKVPEAQWIEEPVADWQNLNGTGINMLDHYYKEPKRWGFTFQTYAIFTRLQKMHEAKQRFPDKIKISERSILADKYVFSQLMKDLGYMDESEYEVFKSLYTSFESMSDIDRTKVIYLRCTPDKCYERLKQRKRSEESEVPLEYLKMIHEKHEQWFKTYPSDKVLIIDTTEDFKNDSVKARDLLARLKEFMES